MASLLSKEKLAAFCEKWQIIEFALFGSAIRNDFRPDSDVDALVTFDPAARWTLFDHVDMQSELKAMLNREVDLVSKRGIERSQNHIRRKEILESAQVIYASS
ncbi:MAG: nucleotidyltransferase domain-containing protein [Ardenticatenaceae bacterium]|nr:nucleotidyltransferase domain-containing protein [Ardenticatenaceae bacterium]